MWAPLAALAGLVQRLQLLALLPAGAELWLPPLRLQMLLQHAPTLWQAAGPGEAAVGLPQRQEAVLVAGPRQSLPGQQQLHDSRIQLPHCIGITIMTTHAHVRYC